jgi:hypothetical protein
MRAARLQPWMRHASSCAQRTPAGICVCVQACKKCAVLRGECHGRRVHCSIALGQVWLSGPPLSAAGRLWLTGPSLLTWVGLMGDFAGGPLLAPVLVVLHHACVYMGVYFDCSVPACRAAWFWRVPWGGRSLARLSLHRLQLLVSCLLTISCAPGRQQRCGVRWLLATMLGVMTVVGCMWLLLGVHMMGGACLLMPGVHAYELLRVPLGLPACSLQ